MSITLPPLPWARDALAPTLSEETIDYHYGKHHAAYVTKLNGLIAGTDWESRPVDDIMMNCPMGGMFNNAAQIWNHTFYWNSLSPQGGGEPSGPIAEAITRDFGSFDNFKKEFNTVAATHFGSGWAWVVKDGEGKLKIVGTHDAGNPLRDGSGTPIITADVWEHAYYIDYRNARPSYLEAFWNIVNWDFANANYSA